MVGGSDGQLLRPSFDFDSLWAPGICISPLGITFNDENPEATGGQVRAWSRIRTSVRADKLQRKSLSKDVLP